MTSLIDIIIRATWAGSQATQQAKRDISGIDDGARKSAGGLQSFATKAGLAAIAIGTVGVAADKAFEALERGAGLELTRRRFDRLAISIGTTGDALREDIGEATGGLLSNAQQMALATDLIALGLANTHDQAVRLARGASELGQDVGELTLALVNQTTRRFDQLGVSAVGFEEKLAALEEQGLNTQDAFTEAFLQQVEEQIERVGGKAGTAAGDLQKLAASFEDVKDAASEALLAVVEAEGGIEALGGVSGILSAIADGFSEIAESPEKLTDAIGIVATLTNPLTLLITKVNDAAGGVADFANKTSEAIVQTDIYKDILTGLTAVMEELGILSRVDLSDGMAAAVAEAESFDRALMNANNTLTEIVGKLAEASANRGGLERGGGGDGRSGEIIRQEFGTIQERVTLFQDFQDDLSAINEQGAADRAAIEEQYEVQRTSIVENYGRQRAQEEEDWQLHRARQEEAHQRSLAEIREGAVEAEQDARADANERLADLEQDHLRRMQDIIDNADLQLSEAASRLDASAVARITRQRDAALRQEERNYSDQRQEIEEQLQEQLVSIRDNMAERIADLEEFHERRQEQEEEDRAIRLNRLEEAHQRELQELDQQYRDRMQDLKDQIRRERQTVTAAYQEAYQQLTTHWSDRQEMEARYQEDILRQEELWWQQRLALVGGDANRAGDTAGGGAGGTVGPGGELPPNRDQLLDLVVELSSGAGYPDQFVQNLLDAMQNWSNLQIATWLERVFNIDIPGYQHGTDFIVPSKYTNDSFLFKASAGERLTIKTPEQQRMDFSERAAVYVTQNIYPSPGMDEALLAKHVEREFEGLLRQLQ